VFEPLDFVARLAALVPRPRVHLTRHHGVFAANSGMGAAITPAGRGSGSGAADRCAALELSAHAPRAPPQVMCCDPRGTGGLAGRSAVIRHALLWPRRSRALHRAA
jgi:hypothetical protein